jgi:hypothetical protein
MLIFDRKKQPRTTDEKVGVPLHWIRSDAVQAIQSMVYPGNGTDAVEFVKVTMNNGSAVQFHQLSVEGIVEVLNLPK